MPDKRYVNYYTMKLAIKNCQIFESFTQCFFQENNQRYGQTYIHTEYIY